MPSANNFSANSPRPLVFPDDLPKRLLSFYAKNARALPWRRDRDPYHVWLSEIMLQQTRAEAVKGYYARFLSVIPSIAALAKTEDETLLKLWEGLGYYSRARNLKKAALEILQTHGGIFPQSLREIERLPGIGAYTAGAIASICFDAPTPAVDGNVLRVAARFCGIEEPVDTPAVKKAITQVLSELYTDVPPGCRGDFTQSLIELGATVCIPGGAPRCDSCPIAADCTALKSGTADKLPVKRPKKEKKVETRTVFVFSCEGALAVRRRENKGLLSGLFEFPNTPQKLDAQQALHFAASLGVEPVTLIKSVERTHIFTHIRWDMTCYYIVTARRTPSFEWADKKAFAQRLPLPTAFRMFLDDLPPEL